MKVWVIDGQSVYCQDGLPHRVFVPKEHLTQDLALDKDTALRLGVDLSLGCFVSYRTLIGMLDNELACELSYAIQLIHHKNTHQYCSRCGTPLHDDACKTCNHHSYPTVSPCIITAVIRTHPTTQKTQLLLAKHHRHAEIYTLIAGFVEMGETLEMAVCREVHEESGLTDRRTHLFWQSGVALSEQSDGWVYRSPSLGRHQTTTRRDSGRSLF